MMDEPRDLTQEALAAAMRRHYEIDVSGVVDWDGVIRAPKERDLMFFVDGIGAGLVKPHETAWFFEGYGEVTVDPRALSYYRHAWAVQDIGGYGENVFLTPDLGEESRSHAARILRGLFDPGGIVELALATTEG
jgi:spectinomycin phosphotransferase